MKNIDNEIVNRFITGFMLTLTILTIIGIIGLLCYNYYQIMGVWIFAPIVLSTIGGLIFIKMARASEEDYKDEI